MILPRPDLPDDVEALKAMIIAFSAEKAATDAEIARMKAVQQTADERITTLTAILKVLQRAQNGTRSERLRLAVNEVPIPMKPPLCSEMIAPPDSGMISPP